MYPSAEILPSSLVPWCSRRRGSRPNRRLNSLAATGQFAPTSVLVPWHETILSSELLKAHTREAHSLTEIVPSHPPHDEHLGSRDQGCKSCVVLRSSFEPYLLVMTDSNCCEIQLRGGSRHPTGFRAYVGFREFNADQTPSTQRLVATWVPTSRVVRMTTAIGRRSWKVPPSGGLGFRVWGCVLFF